MSVKGLRFLGCFYYYHRSLWPFTYFILSILQITIQSGGTREQGSKGAREQLPSQADLSTKKLRHNQIFLLLNMFF